MTSSTKLKAQALYPGRLNSWKEIASYLERDERTVKRWEKSRSLPVRRLPGGRGRVFAFRSEIDAWQISSAGSAEEDSGIQDAAWLEDGADEAEVLENGLPVASAAKESVRPLANHDSPALLEPHPTRIPAWLLVSVCASVLLAVVASGFVARHARTPVRAAVTHQPPVDALNLYLSGRFYWNKRTTQDLRQALSNFNAAVAIDPSYAAAWAGIADCYGLSTEFADVAPQAAYPHMLDAAQRAVALDPNLAEGHRALGFVLFYWNWDREGSRREFQRAIELDPRDATTYHWYGNVLTASQQPEEAIRVLDEARALDPTSPAILADRGLALKVAGNFTQANSVWTTLEQSDPSYLPPHRFLANDYLFRRNIPAYMKEVSELASYSHSADDATLLNAMQQAYREHGDQGVLEVSATAHVHRAEARQWGYVGAALALDTANRRDEALHFLEEAYVHRDQEFPTIANRDSFVDLQGMRGYAELKAKSLRPYPRASRPDPSMAAVSPGPLDAK